uniref:Uncharacterized protein n=1 Tax=Rhizophora mucronata TaxID=61149 RepID=A0A2P2N2X9_RHIMU
MDKVFLNNSKFYIICLTVHSIQPFD